MNGTKIIQAMGDTSFSARFERAREELAKAKNILVVTGAGISAESGVPTFRGAGAHWKGVSFATLLTQDYFGRRPQTVWAWYVNARRVVAASEPNHAHRALAQWAKRRGQVTVVTQNVDDLHERGGQESVFHIHGSLFKNRCVRCGEEREDRSTEWGEDRLPISPCCGELERPGIVWFGEDFPAPVYEAARRSAVCADLILVVGTSGTVVTTGILIRKSEEARREQRVSPPIVIDVNLENNTISAHVVFRGKAGEILPLLLAL